MTIQFIHSSEHISHIASRAATAQYILPFVNRASSLIANVKTSAGLLSSNDENYMPFTVNDTEFDNCYTCSPYTAYISYAMQEMYKVDSSIIHFICQSTLPRLGQYFVRQKINENIHINNWLLSTNLTPSWLDQFDIANLLQSATETYPDHAIIFRSLNEHSNEKFIQNLRSHGFLLIPSRQIYIQDLELHDYSEKRDVKKDLKLLAESEYQLVPESELCGELGRIVDLYNQLYLDKYSLYNPHFTVEFVGNLLENPLFTLEGFRGKTGVLDGVGCRFELGNTMTMPIVGYEMKRPLTDGLYRLIIISAMKHALENGLNINASSGAPDFKRLRGAKPFVEYSAVFVKHLPKSRQRMWRILQKILTSFVVPIMKKYQL